jgi:hypothetical protein
VSEQLLIRQGSHSIRTVYELYTAGTIYSSIRSKMGSCPSASESLALVTTSRFKSGATKMVCPKRPKAV